MYIILLLLFFLLALQHFGPNLYGFLVDFQYDWGCEGPTLPWPPAAMHFGIPSQCWKRTSTLPTMVHGVLVQNILGSWWIFELNMRLGGYPNYHGHQQPYIRAFPSNVVNNPQHCQCWFMGFWCKWFWVKVDFNFNEGFISFFQIFYSLWWYVFLFTNFSHLKCWVD